MPLLNRLLTAIALTAALVAVAIAFGPVTGRYRTTTVLSGSMRPSMDPGDVVLTVPVDVRDVEVGDVLTFQRPNGSGNVTHRVVEVGRVDGQVRVRTKGDANESADSFDVTLRGDTAWRRVAVVPKVGYAFVAARALLAQDLYLPAIGVLIALSLCWTIWRPRPEEATDATAA